MKKIFVLLLIFLTFLSSVFAQVSVNPQDDFYKCVESWKSRNIIQEVPPLRPYSVINIKEILNKVIENGTEKDIEIAQSYLNQLENKMWYVKADAEGTYKTNSDKNFLFYANIKGEGDAAFLEDKLSLGYSAGLSFRNIEKVSTFVPLFENFGNDDRFDPASVGPFFSYLNVNNNISYNFKNIIFQAGMNRLGYGDFINEGLALNDSSYHMPNFSVSYFNNFLSYTQMVGVIGATTNSNVENNIYPSKFIGFHAIELTPINKLSFAFYENVVFGKRFDISYLIPTTYMISQSISGYNDSIMMGLRVRYTPVSSLVLASDLLVDDLGFNELIRFNFDSKNRIAWNTGIKYLPGNSFINNIGLNYTIITPYTYAHWDLENNSIPFTENTINYQNYTNSGYTIGASYAPNSDVVKFAASVSPVSKLNIDFDFSFLRHGNICETLTDEEAIGYLLSDANVYSTDGSIMTHQWGKFKTKDDKGNDIYTINYLPSAWDHLNFLNQENKMYITKANLKADYTILDSNKIKLSVYAAYCFEYIHNKGVDSNMFPGGHVIYDKETQTFIYDDLETATYDEETQKIKYDTIETSSYNEVVKYYKDSWKAQLHNEIFNYISFGFEIRF